MSLESDIKKHELQDLGKTAWIHKSCMEEKVDYMDCGLAGMDSENRQVSAMRAFQSRVNKQQGVLPTL